MPQNKSLSNETKLKRCIHTYQIGAAAHIPCHHQPANLQPLAPSSLCCCELTACTCYTTPTRWQSDRLLTYPGKAVRLEPAAWSHACPEREQVGGSWRACQLCWRNRKSLSAISCSHKDPRLPTAHCSEESLTRVVRPRSTPSQHRPGCQSLYNSPGVGLTP